MAYLVFGKDKRMEKVRQLLSNKITARDICVFAPNIWVSEEELSDIPDGATVFCAGIREAVAHRATERGIKAAVYNDYEEFVKRNAEYTAEAALGIMLYKINSQLSENKVLIVGFGRIGRALARYLFGMAADFSVMTSRPDDAEIYARAISYDEDISEFDVIVNTAPSRVIPDDALWRLKRGVVIIDLASPPYGLNHELAVSIGLDSAIYPALPSKYRSESAAREIVSLISEVENGN